MTFALFDYATNRLIREATEQEYERSVSASKDDGGAGVIDIDGRRCYAL